MLLKAIGVGIHESVCSNRALKFMKTVYNCNVDMYNMGNWATLIFQNSQLFWSGMHWFSSFGNVKYIYMAEFRFKAQEIPLSIIFFKYSVTNPHLMINTYYISRIQTLHQPSDSRNKRLHENGLLKSKRNWK